ncbi:ATP-binding protein [Curtobacterium sp. NPDC090217]|uniref:ATP-binding protein n=1 Tax=Curtobacterium sp. NPDC090217 TaxID=3363970 RepID=UPI0037F50A3B
MTTSSRWSIARRLFTLQLLFVVVGVGVGSVWAWASARSELEAAAAHQSSVIAVTIARNPFVVEQATTRDPSAELEPYALDVMRRTHTDFITIMAPDRTRWTHPDRSQIGRPFRGTIAPALRGETFTETSAGTLGPSVRAVTPITDAEGHVVGLVSAGVTVANIATALVPRLVSVVALALAVIGVSALFSWLLSRYLDRVTAGRGPEELARVFASYEGVLHSVHEGLVVLDGSGTIVLYNDRAADLLDLPAPTDPQTPVPLDSIVLSDGLRTLLASGDRAVDETYETGDRVLVVNQEMAFSRTSSKPLGTVVTLRDHTELLHLSGELAATRTLTDALRSQTHEFANRLHTIVALLELERFGEAIRFASDEIDRSADRSAPIESPGRPDADGSAVQPEMRSAVQPEVLSAVLRGKRAQAHERGVLLTADTTGLRTAVQGSAGDVMTVLGNLVDNAVDAAAERRAGSGKGRVSVAVTSDDDAVRLVVRDDGTGITDIEVASEHGWSTKASGPEGRGIGLGLVRSALDRIGAHMTVTTGPAGSAFVVEFPTDRCRS